jgi:hypothetical protein
MKLKKAHLLFFVILIASCKQKSIPEKEWNAYINDPSNGLLKQQKVNGITLKMFYRPGELFSLQDKSKKQEVIAEKNASFIYFLMRISVNDQDIFKNIGNSTERTALFKKLSFETERFIRIENSNNELTDLSGFNYIENAGIVPYTDILLIIDKKNIHYDTIEWLSINVNEFGLNTGSMQFKFKKEDLEKVNN